MNNNGNYNDDSIKLTEAIQSDNKLRIIARRILKLNKDFDNEFHNTIICCVVLWEMKTSTTLFNTFSNALIKNFFNKNEIGNEEEFNGSRAV